MPDHKQARHVNEPAKYRAFQVRAPSTLDETKRTVDAVLATENPVPMIDWDEFEMVPEVLLMSGAELPEGGRMPLCNSHQMRGIGDVLGSCTNVRVEGGEMPTTLEFAEDDDGERAMKKVRGRHVRDLSIGYKVHERVKVKAGETVILDGRQFAGPVNVATRWTVFEGSLCPIGADYAAKIREAMTNGKHGAVRAGENEGGKTMPDTNTNTNTTVPGPVAPPPAPGLDEVAVKEREQRAMAEGQRIEGERQNEIRSMCRQFNVAPEFEAELVKPGITVAEANKRMLALLAKQNAPIPQAPQRADIQGGLDDGEKFRAAVVHGIVMRSGHTRIEKPAPGADEFRGKSLIRICEEILVRHGVRGIASMGADQIASMILGNKRAGGYRPIIAATADFEHICLDASNMSLQRAFEEAPRIWPLITNKAYHADFKTIHVAKLSESPNLEAIDENGEYEHAAFSDQAESYAVQVYGRYFTITRKAIMNDSRRAFDRIPRAFGAAAQRKIEQLVIALLTSNPVMSDGEQVFSAAHLNIASGAAFSKTTVQALSALMSVQKGFGEDTPVLDIGMKFSLVPVALKHANREVCLSNATTADSKNAGVINTLREDGIVPLASGLLDASSTIVHYGIADPAMYDGLEVGFLDGGDAPVIEMADQMNVDGRIFHVRHDIGAAVIDHKSLARHAGV